MLKKLLLVALCLLLLACNRRDGAVEGESAKPVTLADQAGHVTSAAGVSRAVAADDYLKGTYWPAAKLGSGTARVSCEYDYASRGDGVRIRSLEFFSLIDALSDCQPRGVVRLHYQGKIDAGFTSLVERVAAIATRMEIGTRVLDIDSAGGNVEEALKAGDSIADAHWAIWVREDSQCHSACVLILAAGDTRSIAGKVGIHRLIRDRSTATSRTELNDELKNVNSLVRDYLERNGVASAVADLMMTIPNRNLRILSDDELKLYGLAGTNAAEDDLDRIRLMRKCGEAFVRRRDAFGRAFDSQCMAPGKAFEAMNQCGMDLRAGFGFPDPTCPDDGPMEVSARAPDLPMPMPRPRDSGGDGHGDGDDEPIAAALPSH